MSDEKDQHQTEEVVFAVLSLTNLFLTNSYLHVWDLNVFHVIQTDKDCNDPQKEGGGRVIFMSAAHKSVPLIRV